MPAMLNVLVGAPKVMLHRAAASETEAKGVWRLSHRAMSQWISSETTSMPRSSQKAASRRSVSGSQTMPPGLCGLESSSRRHRSSATRANWSKSIE